MSAALELAHAYGVAVVLADLGDWGSAQLRSEYDPKGPTIRVNRRIAQRLGRRDYEDFIALAVGHELYHHRQRIGEIAASGNRGDRERAAERYARDLSERFE